MSFTLRDYQEQQYGEIRLALRRVPSVLVQSPTGSGKTVLVANMARNASAKGVRVWFIVHRRELVKQSVATFTAAGVDVGIVAAGFRENRAALVQVCSVGSLKKRMAHLPKPDLLIVDEAHHAVAASWKLIIEAYPDAKVIGLTATPERLDGAGLGQYFKELIVGPSVAALTEAGWLSPYRLYAPGGPDLSGVHTVAGDYNKKELAAAMDHSTVTGDALEHYRKYAAGRRAVCFLYSVESSIAIVQQFNAAGVPSAHIDGGTSEAERDAAIQGFREGRILMLSNVDIVSEGFDLPAIDAVFLLRPTRSLGLFLQQAGRGLRPFEGKTEALIFDHAGNCRVHGLPDDEREWSLEGRRRKRTDNDECPVRQCPKCYVWLRANARACKHCGYEWPLKAREIDKVAGELGEVDKDALRASRKAEERAARTVEELAKIGEVRGYKNPRKWAEIKFSFRNAYRGRGKPYEFPPLPEVEGGWR